MARPRKEIDQEEFENLCKIQCTKSEMCAFFDVTDKTLESWCKRTYRKGFSEVFVEKRGLGKISLRRTQFRMAEKNPTMAIWLGKQYLDQKDKIEQDNKEALKKLDEVLGQIKGVM
nr:MAG TPA: DNA-packaging protein small subunit [Caudoviricetes sp.]